jgi:hypothetical protein
MAKNARKSGDCASPSLRIALDKLGEAVGKVMAKELRDHGIKFPDEMEEQKGGDNGE